MSGLEATHLFSTCHTLHIFSITLAFILNGSFTQVAVLAQTSITGILTGRWGILFQFLLNLKKNEKENNRNSVN